MMRAGRLLGGVFMWGLLWAAPAMADDLAEMNAVSKLWDRYAELSNADKVEAVELLSESSLAHFGFVRDAALYASTEQLRRIPAIDRLTIYLLRATQSEQALKAMDDREVAELCMKQGWIGVDRNGEEPLLALTHVTVMGDIAVGEVAPPTESQYQFGPDFVRESDGWRYRFESLIPDASVLVEQSIKQAGINSTQMYEAVIADFLKTDSPPSLAALDRPLLDDAVARVRLNERWPKYDLAYERRIAAVAQKAKDGDSFAQFVYGTLKLAGNLPQWVKKDEIGGLELLEKASDGGNADAAELAARYLTDEPSQLDEVRLARVTRHLTRAANAGKAFSMNMLGSFYFEGTGGLPQDCRRAAEWQERAEEAGEANARNSLVWTWATCPIAEQRDPTRALELAQHMIEQEATLSGGQLDTVAAALAANGKFDEAADYQQRAIDKILASFDESKARNATIKRMRARLAGYRKGRDYVQDYNSYAEIRAGRM